jgi:hypothetical protein
MDGFAVERASLMASLEFALHLQSSMRTMLMLDKMIYLVEH